MLLVVDKLGEWMASITTLASSRSAPKVCIKRRTNIIAGPSIGIALIHQKVVYNMEEIPNLSGEAEMTSVHKLVQPEDRINLAPLEKQLHFKPGEFIELGLTSQGRKLIYNGSLDRPSWTGGKDEILVFLFDHVLLFVKPVKADRYHVFRQGKIYGSWRIILTSSTADSPWIFTGFKYRRDRVKYLGSLGS